MGAVQVQATGFFPGAQSEGDKLDVLQIFRKKVVGKGSVFRVEIFDDGFGAFTPEGESAGAGGSLIRIAQGIQFVGSHGDDQKGSAGQHADGREAPFASAGSITESPLNQAGGMIAPGSLEFSQKCRSQQQSGHQHQCPGAKEGASCFARIAHDTQTRSANRAESAYRSDEKPLGRSVVSLFERLPLHLAFGEQHLSRFLKLFSQSKPESHARDGNGPDQSTDHGGWIEMKRQSGSADRIPPDGGKTVKHSFGIQHCQDRAGDASQQTQ